MWVLEMHYSCTYFVLSMNNPEQYVGISSICVTQNAINIWHLNWHVGFEKLKIKLRQQGNCKQFHLSRLTELCSQCFDFFKQGKKTASVWTCSARKGRTFLIGIAHWTSDRRDRLDLVPPDPWSHLHFSDHVSLIVHYTALYSSVYLIGKPVFDLYNILLHFL